MNQSQKRSNETWTKIAQLNENQVDSEIQMLARVHTSRAVGAKMVFINLRQKMDTIQSILTMDKDSISKQFLKFASTLADESLVIVKAKVVKAAVLVTGCTVQEYELQILELHLVSEAARLPFSIDDASRPEVELADVFIPYVYILMAMYRNLDLVR